MSPNASMSPYARTPMSPNASMSPYARTPMSPNASMSPYVRTPMSSTCPYTRAAYSLTSSLPSSGPVSSLPYIVGPREQTALVRVREQPALVGAREQPSLVGVREQPSLVGIRQQPALVGVREQPALVRVREQPALVGVREQRAAGVIGRIVLSNYAAVKTSKTWHFKLGVRLLWMGTNNLFVINVNNKLTAIFGSVNHRFKN